MSVAAILPATVFELVFVAEFHFASSDPTNRLAVLIQDSVP